MFRKTSLLLSTMSLALFAAMPVGAETHKLALKIYDNQSDVNRSVRLYADDSFDVSVANGTRPMLQAAGLQLAMDERYSSNASDFNTLLRK